MDDKRQKEIVNILEENDSRSIQFIKTKNELLENGYKEKEIILALYSFPYDGKPNTPKEENPLTKWYEEHPEKADKVAKTLLRDHATHERNKSYLYAAASEFAPDQHAKSYFEVRMFDQLGLPYFILFFIGIALYAIIIKLDSQEFLIYIYAYAVNLWVIYKLVQSHKKTKK